MLPQYVQSAVQSKTKSVKTKGLSLYFAAFWWRFLTQCTTAWTQNWTALSDADLHVNCLLALAWPPGKHLTFTRTCEFKNPTWTDTQLSSFKPHLNVADTVTQRQAVMQSFCNNLCIDVCSTHFSQSWSLMLLKKKPTKTFQCVFPNTVRILKQGENLFTFYFPVLS